MKKFLKSRKAKGFTLVELLIVLIIIGILAGALLLVAGAGTDKANATKIVSNLRSAKAAALMGYADKNGNWGAVVSSDIWQYMDKGTETDKLDFQNATSADSTVWVSYTNATLIPSGGGVEEKLIQLRESGVPLYKTHTSAAVSPDYDGGASVYMKVN